MSCSTTTGSGRLLLITTPAAPRACMPDRSIDLAAAAAANTRNCVHHSTAAASGALRGVCEAGRLNHACFGGGGLCLSSSLPPRRPPRRPYHLFFLASCWFFGRRLLLGLRTCSLHRRGPEPVWGLNARTPSRATRSTLACCNSGVISRRVLTSCLPPIV
jgi:hypothetical protein